MQTQTGSCPHCWTVYAGLCAGAQSPWIGICCAPSYACDELHGLWHPRRLPKAWQHCNRHSGSGAPLVRISAGVAVGELSQFVTDHAVRSSPVLSSPRAVMLRCRLLINPADSWTCKKTPPAGCLRLTLLSLASKADRRQPAGGVFLHVQQSAGWMSRRQCGITALRAWCMLELA